MLHRSRVKKMFTRTWEPYVPKREIECRLYTRNTSVTRLGATESRLKYRDLPTSQLPEKFTFRGIFFFFFVYSIPTIDFINSSSGCTLMYRNLLVVQGLKFRLFNLDVSVGDFVGNRSNLVNSFVSKTWTFANR